MPSHGAALIPAPDLRAGEILLDEAGNYLATIAHDVKVTAWRIDPDWFNESYRIANIPAFRAKVAAAVSRKLAPSNAA